MMDESERRVTGRHVLIGILAFFGVVIAVNGIFVYSALNTWTGLTTEHAYVEGLNYNQEIAKAERQRQLGWETTIDLAASPEGSRRLVFKVTDRDGTPVDGLDVTARLRRPTHEGFDSELRLHGTAAGTYAAQVEFPLDGVWEARLVAFRRGDDIYEAHKRLWVK